MLHLIVSQLPAPLHRALLRLGHGLRIAWWTIRRPRLVGVRVLALDPQGQVLLVRHSYGSRRWMLPGGGVARGEAPIAAAVRELAEETGCTLTRAREIAMTRRAWHGADNIVHVIAGQTRDTPQPDRREIVAARCFPPAALPADMNRGTAQELAEWVRIAQS